MYKSVMRSSNRLIGVELKVILDRQLASKRFSLGESWSSTSSTHARFSVSISRDAYYIWYLMPAAFPSFISFLLGLLHPYPSKYSVPIKTKITLCHSVPIVPRKTKDRVGGWINSTNYELTSNGTGPKKTRRCMSLVFLVRSLGFEKRRLGLTMASNIYYVYTGNKIRIISLCCMELTFTNFLLCAGITVGIFDSDIYNVLAIRFALFVFLCLLSLHLNPVN